MTEITDHRGKYADFEGLREQAVALRREGLSLRQISEELGVHNKETLSRLVQGEPPAEWTKRPRAKDELRDQARELRRQGRTYNEIQAELGCSKSSISLWVRDLPHPEPKCTPEEQRARMNAGLARLRADQDRERRATKQEAAAAIGELSDREVLIAGVALYWAEGSKDKPYRRTEVLQYWVDVVGVDQAAFSRATLKKHNPRTVRKNIGDGYYGCLMIYVRQKR